MTGAVRAGRWSYFTCSSNCQGTRKTAINYDHIFWKLLFALRVHRSKGTKVFIFRVWLLFWHCPVLNTWNHLYNGGCSRVCAVGLWNRSSPSSPGVMPNLWADIHFHFLAQPKHMQRGWKTSCFFYNWAQRYKNLILSPFMLPIKLQMLLLNGVPLMHIIEWFLSHLHYDITGPNVACFLC